MELVQVHRPVHVRNRFPASCRWRSSADWVDRLGRFLGGLWIAAALVFSLRHALA
jgi:hypothetical protein